MSQKELLAINYKAITDDVVKVEIDVTEDDIKRGKRDSCGECPVARAVSRLVDGYVSVGAGQIHIDGVGFNMAPEAIEFMRKFDNREKVEPFRFEIELYEFMTKHYDKESTYYDYS